eukprot:683762-Rhodomonas_salina.1
MAEDPRCIPRGWKELQQIQKHRQRSPAAFTSRCQELTWLLPNRRYKTDQKQVVLPPAYGEDGSDSSIDASPTGGAIASLLRLQKRAAMLVEIVALSAEEPASDLPEPDWDASDTDDGSRLQEDTALQHAMQKASPSTRSLIHRARPLPTCFASWSEPVFGGATTHAACMILDRAVSMHVTWAAHVRAQARAFEESQDPAAAEQGDAKAQFNMGARLAKQRKLKAPLPPPSTHQLPPSTLHAPPSTLHPPHPPPAPIRLSCLCLCTARQAHSDSCLVQAAVAWFRRAAQQSHPKAQYNLAVCMLNGEPSPSQQ